MTVDANALELNEYSESTHCHRQNELCLRREAGILHRVTVTTLGFIDHCRREAGACPPKCTMHTHTGPIKCVKDPKNANGAK